MVHASVLMESSLYVVSFSLVLVLRLLYYVSGLRTVCFTNLHTFNFHKQNHFFISQFVKMIQNSRTETYFQKDEQTVGLKRMNKQNISSEVMLIVVFIV